MEVKRGSKSEQFFEREHRWLQGEAAGDIEEKGAAKNSSAE